jgi:hypothetical protein
MKYRHWFDEDLSYRIVFFVPPQATEYQISEKKASEFRTPSIDSQEMFFGDSESSFYRKLNGKFMKLLGESVLSRNLCR